MATTTTTTATTPDCTSHCRSAECATNLISVITRGSTRQIKTYMERCCGNPAHVSDRYGRTALHVAASCGKWRVVDWLLAKKGAEWRSKDKESGWTALHRSLFYGQVMSAVYLIYVSGSGPCMVLARDPSTHLLDGLFHLWTGKNKKIKSIFCKFLGIYEVLYVFLNIWVTKVA